MTNQPRVAVIVPTFNRASYLPTSLESILAQTHSPSQVIVVDDGSEDETPQVIRPYLGAVQYLRKPNGGKAAAVNHALPLVRAEYLWVFDDDDVACPDALERHVAVLEADPELGFSYSGAYSCSSGPNGQLCVESVNPVRSFSDEEGLMELMMACYTASPAVVVRMDLVRHAGPHRTELARSGDLEIAIRWLLRAPAARLPDDRPTYYRRYHDGLRGPHGARFQYSKNWQSARRYERYIFRQLDLGLELSHFLPRNEWNRPLNIERERRARARRAALSLRKGLWERARCDLETLLDLGLPAGSLNAEDRNHLRGALNTYPSCIGLVREVGALEVRPLLRQPGLSVLREELLRGVVYMAWEQARQRAAGRFAQVAGCLLRVFGWHVSRDLLAMRSSGGGERIHA